MRLKNIDQDVSVGAVCGCGRVVESQVCFSVSPVCQHMSNKSGLEQRGEGKCSHNSSFHQLPSLADSSAGPMDILCVLGETKRSGRRALKTEGKQM